MARDPRAEHALEAARRTARSSAPTPEDAILFALLERGDAALEEVKRLAREAALLDHDYLEYWADELRLRRGWRD